MKIGLRYGHSINCRGARGKLDEVDSCKELFPMVSDLLISKGHIVVDCNSNAYDVDTELAEGTNKANSNGVDVYITLHLNAASNASANGVECWAYNSTSSKAITIGNKICSNIAALGTSNRGMKYNSGFHDLSESNMEALIVEILFCTNEDDANLFRNKKNEIAVAIANGIDSNITIAESPSTPPVVKPPVTPPVKEKVNVTYQVYTNGRWLPNVVNLNDYAGLWNQPVSAVYANTDRGYLQYRVHTKNGSWLPWVIDRRDYAGIYGVSIDAIQMQLLELPNHNVKYRAYTNGSWLPWVTNLSDYAGIYGQAIEEIQIYVE